MHHQHTVKVQEGCMHCTTTVPCFPLLMSILVFLRAHKDTILSQASWTAWHHAWNNIPEICVWELRSALCEVGASGKWRRECGHRRRGVADSWSSLWHVMLCGGACQGNHVLVQDAFRWAHYDGKINKNLHHILVHNTRNPYLWISDNTEQRTTTTKTLQESQASAQ